LKDHFSNFENTVNILYFNSAKKNPDFCLSTKSILYELNSISPKINLKIFDFDKDKNTVHKYNIMMPPATVIQSNTDIGLRYYGIPSGYEFSTLINSITIVGKGTVIEANEFPELSREFNVMAVPKTVINKRHSFEGAFREERFFEELIKEIS